MKLSIPSIIEHFLNLEIQETIKTKISKLHKLSNSTELKVSMISEIVSFLDLCYERDFRSFLQLIVKNNFKYKFEIVVYSDIISNDKIGLGGHLKKLKFEKMSENLFFQKSEIHTSHELNKINSFMIKTTFVYFFN